jgi:hypothetical protein
MCPRAASSDQHLSADTLAAHQALSETEGMSNRSQGIGALVIAAIYAGHHFTQPHRGGAYGDGELIGTIAVIVLFAGFGLYKLRKS